MNKSKHLKKNRLIKKTKKYYGGNSDKQLNNNSNNNSNNNNDNESISETIDKKEGVIDIIGNKVSSFAEDTGSFVKDKTLRLFGLQPINADESSNMSQQVSATANKLNDLSSGILAKSQSIGNDVVNVFNKGSAAIIGNINDVLNSPEVENSVVEAAQQTSQIGTKLLKKFNENLDNPEFKEETKKYLENVSDYAEIGIKALNEPLDQAIDEFSEAGNKAAAGIAAGIVKVGTDAMGAIPGFGAVIDVGKMINDGTKAVSTAVEAGSDAIETASELFIKTNDGFQKGIKELEEKKNEAMNIANRTTNAINHFQNMNDTINNQMNKSATKVGGGYCKSKKRLLKRKAKSKKVRFAS